MTDYAKVSGLTEATIVTDTDLIEISQDQGGGAFLSKKVTGANSINSKLASTGATTGATSQAQTFTNGVKTAKIIAPADSTTAVGIFKADSTTNVLNVDTTNGRVGIGTTAPSNPLHVYSPLPAGADSNSNTPLRFDKVTAATNATRSFLIGSAVSTGDMVDGFGGRFKFLISDTGAADKEIVAIAGIRNGGDGMGALVFQTSRTDSDLAEAMRINSSGNVGIGTTGPTNKLEISGTNEADNVNLLTLTNTSVSSGSAASLIFAMTSASSSVNRQASIKGIRNTVGGATALAFNTSDGTNLLERVRIDNLGNVGIGTTTPVANLNVVGGAGAFAIQSAAGALGTGYAMEFSTSASLPRVDFVNNGVYVGQFSSNATDVLFKNNLNTTGNIDFQTKTSNALVSRLYITNGGNVGIGTMAPLSIQHIKSDLPYLTFSRTTSELSADYIAGLINFYSADASPNSTGGIGSISVRTETNYNTGSTPSYMAFYTHPNSANNATLLGAATEKMRITAAGNVGIGTTAPGTRLHVKNGTGGSAPNASYDVMAIENNAIGYVNFITPEANRSGFIFSGSNRANGGFIYTNADTQFGANTTQSLIFLTNGFQPRMLIDGSGNVGIGTTTPGSKLTVSGHIGSLGTIPTLTSAGAGASIRTGSTDTAGEITQGTLATGAVITFANAYTNIPFAIVTSQAGLLFSYTVSTTAITITNIGALSETKLNYHVVARE